MGIEVNYKLEGNRNAPSLLLLHELGGSQDSWQWLTPKIKEHFNLILVDLPGAGKSPVTSESMSLDDISNSLAELVDELNFGKVNVAGSAFGAINAAYFAANYPEKVDKLLLMAIGPSISQEVHDYVHNRANEVEAKGMEFVVEYSLNSSFPKSMHEERPDIIAEYRKIYLGNDPKNYAISSRAVANAGTVLTDRIQNIKAKTMLVGGLHDPSFTPEVIEEVANLLNPKVEPMILENAGHFPQIQSPEEVAQLMHDFFIRYEV